MKFLHLTVFVLCLTLSAYANPIPEEDDPTEKVQITDEISKSEENKKNVSKEINESQPEDPKATTIAPKTEITTKEKVPNKEHSRTEKARKLPAKESVSLDIKSSPISTAKKIETPISNPSEMHIKSWGPKDYEYSFKTDNQKQAKTIHIEDKPEDEDNPYDVSDTGSFSIFNAENAYEYKVEYTAGSDGYRPKVSFSFHS